jgi:pentatricopeptide repeat protein
LIRAFGAQGRFDAALAAFADLRAAGIAPTAFSYTALISACAQQRNKDAAFVTLEAMQSAGVQPTEVTYGALMQACVRSLDMASAFSVLNLAQADGIRLTPVHFTHLIVGCVHNGMYEQAWETYNHMRVHHGKADAVAYTAMIGCCAKTDQVERALGILDEMKQMNVEPTHVTYNALIHAAGRSFRRYDFAFRLFDEMKVAGFAPDLRSYQGVILACSHTGDVPKARHFLWQLHSEGLVPDQLTLNCALAVYMRALGPANLDPQKRSVEDIIAARASGADLLALEDSELMQKIDRFHTKRVVGDYARLVEGDVNVLTEKLLADYFNDANPDGRVDDDDLAPLEASEQDTMRDLMPKAIQALSQDLQDPLYKQSKEFLTQQGLVDRSMFEAFEDEEKRPPPMDSDEESARWSVDLHEEAHFREKAEAQAIELAEADAKARRLDKLLFGRKTRIIDGMETRADERPVMTAADIFMRSDRARTPGVAGIGESQSLEAEAAPSAGLMFSEIASQIEEKHKGALAHRDDAAASSDADEDRHVVPGSQLLVRRRDGRVSFSDYLRRLEQDVEEEIMGMLPSSDDESAASAELAAAIASGNPPALDAITSQPVPGPRSTRSPVNLGDGRTTVRGDSERRVSLFDKDGLIGGKTLAEITDIRDIPVPKELEDSDGDVDMVQLHDYYSGRVTERLLRALRKEYKPILDAADTMDAKYSDPELSENAEEYRRIWKARKETVARASQAETTSTTASSSQSSISSTDGLKDVRSACVSPLVPKDDMAQRDAVATVPNESGVTVSSGPVQPAIILERVALPEEPTPHTGLVRRRRSGTAPNVGFTKESLRPVSPAILPLGEDAVGAVQLAPRPASLALTIEPEEFASRISDPSSQGSLPPSAAAYIAPSARNIPGRTERIWSADDLAAATSTKSGTGERSLSEAESSAEMESDMIGSIHTASSDGAMDVSADILGLNMAPTDTKRQASARHAQEAWAKHAERLAQETPEKKERRSLVARLAERMIKNDVDAFSANLMESVEPVDKYRKRKTEGLRPGMLDTLFAVQQLKEKAANESATTSMPQPSEAMPAAVVDAGDIRLDSEIAGMDASVAKALREVREKRSMMQDSDVRKAIGDRHERRQSEALDNLTNIVAAKPGHQRGVQPVREKFQALSSMSGKLLSGAHWLPRENYPTDLRERKRVLIEEMRRIYYEEMPRHDVQPSLITLNTVVTAYALAGQNKMAYDFLAEEFPKHGCKPDTRTYRALIGLHVRQKRTDRAETVFETMKSLAVPADKDCYGLLVHSMAREYRLKDAVNLVKEMKAQGLTCSEHYAFLLRQRCKEVGIFHPDVPAHPVGWQFTPSVMKKRRARGRVMSKIVAVMQPARARKMK